MLIRKVIETTYTPREQRAKDLFDSHVDYTCDFEDAKRAVQKVYPGLSPLFWMHMMCLPTDDLLYVQRVLRAEAKDLSTSVDRESDVYLAALLHGINGPVEEGTTLHKALSFCLDSLATGF